MIKIIRYFFLFSFLSVFFSCAMIVSPNGGEKDILPPKVIEINPDNYKTNFRESKFDIKFDEFIQLKNLSNELIISPPIDPKPDIFIIGKIVRVKLNSEILDSSTYVIDFGQSIIDITESNAVQNLKLIFSKDTVLDSLTIKGTIYDAYTLKPIEKAVVGLYKLINDSVQEHYIPNYIAKTNKEGEFYFNYLPKEKFKLVAFSDKNNNYKYNPISEGVAFDTLPVYSSNTSDSINNTFYYFNELPKSNRILYKYFDTKKLQIIFQSKINSPRIYFLDSNGFENHVISKSFSFFNDTIIYYMDSLLDYNRDIVIENIELFDTLNLSSLIKLNLKDIKEPTILNQNKGTLIPNDYLKITFKEPVIDYSDKQIPIINSNDTIYKIIDSISEDKLSIYLIVDINKKDKYNISIYPGTVKTYYSGWNLDTLSFSVNVNSEQEYGSLNIQFEVDSNMCLNRIIQIINSKYEVIRELYVVDNQNVKIDYILPSDYHVRLVYDCNNNKMFDVGSVIDNILPEKCLILNDKVSIKAGWELKILWVLKNNLSVIQ